MILHITYEVGLDKVRLLVQLTRFYQPGNLIFRILHRDGSFIPLETWIHSKHSCQDLTLYIQDVLNALNPPPPPHTYAILLSEANSHIQLQDVKCIKVKWRTDVCAVEPTLTVYLLELVCVSVHVGPEQLCMSVLIYRSEVAKRLLSGKCIIKGFFRSDCLTSVHIRSVSSGDCTEPNNLLKKFFPPPLQ